ncbi:hypothetical protein QN277_020672 [Acacia crassicarpa]|uniref:Senescence-associated carboxylesterase 101 n=1 Tax=Acacia crassicarpa TaxID=499986 RepID=A0AAE1JPI0_9FABA|nr:hypothetical protein QN277_020672 [Acacia crassicarpa]
MTQGTTQLFSGGFETASVVASSGLLSPPWNLIADLNSETHPNENLFWKRRSYGPDLTIIAFGTTQNHVQPDLLPSTEMMDNPFEFLCSKKNPSFSLNQSVMSLFNDNLQSLGQLKSQIDLKKPVIVTGHAVGGSLASLFTLWLIEKMDSSDKHPLDKLPLCITFGSPLVGDKSLQEAIARSSNWNSCFLHVVHPRDPLLSTFNSNDSYRPFGTFLLCSDYGSTCSENPDSILRLFKETSTLHQGLQIQGYGNIVERLTSKWIWKDPDVPSIPQNLLQASFALQLQALGLSQNNLVKDLERQEVLLTLNKRKRFIPNKKLDDMKIYMAYLEWYKKTCKNSGRGYYDCYKNEWFPRDQDVVMYVRILTNYWKDIVEEVAKQPQKEGKAFRTRWLYAGTNYRRMVEPLDIAQYYKEGGHDYINLGRSEHYKQLQKWQEEDKKEELKKEEDKKPEPIKPRNVQSILTLDSCFWAHVEEALTSLRKCKAGSSVAEKKEATAKLDEFEDYVYRSLKNYSVSPEIFLESSYMEWWKEYTRFKESLHGSRLANFMKNYAKYGDGEYDFSRE